MYKEKTRLIIIDMRGKEMSKKRYPLLFGILLLIFLTVSGCNKFDKSKLEKTQRVANKKVELTISAAASLQDVLNDIKNKFENEHSNVKIIYNFGASGDLQQQISQGAPVDLFFSAAEEKFEQLVEEGLIEKKRETNLVGNELVFVVPKNEKKGLKDFNGLNKDIKISIGTPETVPAGQYAKETLQNLNTWNNVKGNVVYAKDVRQVLTYVETGNVDAGIVYKTDALTSKKVKTLAIAENSTHSPIIYPLGIIKSSKHLTDAQLFYDYIQNDKSMNIFQEYGFTPLK
jgi:molybdate transport system substrate-binding protein